MTYYTIYKITNTSNGKIYIGRHQTSNLDDGYMGSSKLVDKAIEKYGIDSFTKEYLHIFDNEQDMINKEADIVTEDFCSQENVYNLSVGGLGTCNFNHPEIFKKAHKNALKKLSELRNDDEWFSNVKKKMSESQKARIKKHGAPWVGKTHTETTKEKMSQSQQGKHDGSKNSQYGTMWVHSLDEKCSKKIKKEDFPKWESNGWLKGRKMKF